MTDTGNAINHDPNSIDKIIKQLKAGNARFMSGQPNQQNYDEQRLQTATGQDPMAFILSCIDARVPPEIIFDQGLGNLFVARVAGNVVNRDIVASMEFAITFPHMKLIMVLGHTDCGAIKAACDGADSGNLPRLIAKIMPALDLAAADGTAPNAENPKFIKRASQHNVRIALDSIRTLSPELKQHEAAGQLALTGAVYNVKTGSVEFLGRI